MTELSVFLDSVSSEIAKESCNSLLCGAHGSGTMPVMDTQAAIKLAGGIRQLAELLGLSTQAIYAWGDSVPQLRMYQLRELRPAWFKAKAKA